MSNGYTPIETIKLLGDASSRRYYISTCREARVCISYDVNEFIQNKDFLKMTELFKNYVRTPKILIGNNPELIVQEDLGNISLNLYMTTNPEERKRLVKQAIDDLVKYQSISVKDFKNVSCYEFDDVKINFEFELAKEFFLEKYLGAKVDQEIMDKAKKSLMNFFRDNKSTVCHRDYHSRNLMVLNNQLVHIDYQDARIGPSTYDLVSLLEDSYFQYSESEKTELKNYFLEINQKINIDTFEQNYNMAAIQRIFKALGSFCYLKIEKNKVQYEKNIGLAFENLRKILESMPEFSDFRKELCRVYYAN